MIPATVALLLYGLFGAIDGVYLHLWRYRLHARPDSRREHLWHTLRALLYPAGVGLIFAAPTGGVLLWAGAAVAAVDLVLLLVDVLEEPGSRTEMGGLPGREYALHVVLTVLHIAAVVLALGARPVSAWALDAPAVLAIPHPAFAEVVAVNLIPGGILVAALHLLLLWRPTLLPVRAAASA